MRAWQWITGSVAALGLAAVVVSCGSTGGGGSSNGNSGQQFIRNSSNAGQLTLNVDPGQVDANKSDRIGLVAVLSDSHGNGISGVPVTFSSDIDDITFIPVNGTAVTDASGRADVIAVAGVSPTATGAIVGTGAIFAEPSRAFGLRAQVPITLFDVGFIDTVDGLLGVIPTALELVEPAPGQVLFFNIVGGTPPYLLKNEISGIGAAVISQHCLPGCTENGGVLCIGSPCQDDTDCNLSDSPSPAGVCAGPIKRCLASCQGANCGGSRCEIDADCNDGSPTPANVCKDSGQSVAYIISPNPASGTHDFVVEDSIAGSVTVSVTTSFVCGNGTARGEEQCDLGSVNDAVCASYGLSPGCSQASVLAGYCASIGITTVTSSTVNCNDCQLALTCEGSGGGTGATATPGSGATFTPGGGVVTPTPTPASTPGGASTLALALIANRSGNNGNGTFTNVMSATVSDSNGNPVPDGSIVTFSVEAPTSGAVISTSSATNTDPPCDVTDFEIDTGTQVLNQPGVAHACLTYPAASAGADVTVHGNIGGIDVPFTFGLPNQGP